MSDLLQQNGIFEKQLIHYKVEIPFQKLHMDLESQFISYAENHIMNQCEKEGYISNQDCKVVSYSAGKSYKSLVCYDVLYEFQVCFPYENMIFRCIVQSITKIGIKAVISSDENENPIVVFASHLQNPSIFENENDVKYNVGDKIDVKVISHRFEIHDPSIYVLVEII